MDKWMNGWIAVAVALHQPKRNVPETSRDERKAKKKIIIHNSQISKSCSIRFESQLRIQKGVTLFSSYCCFGLVRLLNNSKFNSKQPGCQSCSRLPMLARAGNSIRKLASASTQSYLQSQTSQWIPITHYPRSKRQWIEPRYGTSSRSSNNSP